MADASDTIVMSPLETHLSEAFEELLAAMMIATDDSGPWSSECLETLSGLVGSLVMAGRLYATHKAVRDKFAGVLMRIEDERQTLSASLIQALMDEGLIPPPPTAHSNV